MPRLDGFHIYDFAAKIRAGSLGAVARRLKIFTGREPVAAPQVDQEEDNEPQEREPRFKRTPGRFKKDDERLDGPRRTASITEGLRHKFPILYACSPIP